MKNVHKIGERIIPLKNAENGFNANNVSFLDYGRKKSVTLHSPNDHVTERLLEREREAGIGVH